MDLEEVVLALVGLGQFANCQIAADFALNEGDLLCAVEPIVDSRQMHTAFEHSYCVLVAALLLQGEPQADQLFR